MKIMESLTLRNNIYVDITGDSEKDTIDRCLSHLTMVKIFFPNDLQVTCL